MLATMSAVHSYDVAMLLHLHLWHGNLPLDLLDLDDAHLLDDLLHLNLWDRDDLLDCLDLGDLNDPLLNLHASLDTLLPDHLLGNDLWNLNNPLLDLDNPLRVLHLGDLDNLFHHLGLSDATLQ